MLKRNFNQTNSYSSKKIKSNIEFDFQEDYTSVLNKISLLLENINKQLEICEKRIDFLTNCKIKDEQEKLEKKLHDEELFRSYIN
jgi:DNA-binding ferritin-like protein